MERKSIKLGTVSSLLALPLLLLAGALAIPFNIIAFAIQSRRERKFYEQMRASGRTMDFSDYLEQVNRDSGTLIVERFSFEGPVRRWWTSENVEATCPYALADWFTMAKEGRFDEAVGWFSQRYTGSKGQARLVVGDKEQWQSVRGDTPMSFRTDLRWIQIPGPRAEKR